MRETETRVLRLGLSWEPQVIFVSCLAIPRNIV